LTAPRLNAVTGTACCGAGWPTMVRLPVTHGPPTTTPYWVGFGHAKAKTNPSVMANQSASR
jgi:hypothetical protein